MQVFVGKKYKSNLLSFSSTISVFSGWSRSTHFSRIVVLFAGTNFFVSDAEINRHIEGHAIPVIKQLWLDVDTFEFASLDNQSANLSAQLHVRSASDKKFVVKPECDMSLE